MQRQLLSLILCPGSSLVRDEFAGGVEVGLGGCEVEGCLAVAVYEAVSQASSIF